MIRKSGSSNNDPVWVYFVLDVNYFLLSSLLPFEKQHNALVSREQRWSLDCLSVLNLFLSIIILRMFWAGICDQSRGSSYNNNTSCPSSNAPCICSCQGRFHTSTIIYYWRCLSKLIFCIYSFCTDTELKVVLYSYSTTVVPLPQRDRISEGLKSRCQPRGLSWLVPPERIALLWLLCICTYLCICLMVYLCICVIHWAELVSWFPSDFCLTWYLLVTALSHCSTVHCTV